MIRIVKLDRGLARTNPSKRHIHSPISSINIRLSLLTSPTCHRHYPIQLNGPISQKTGQGQVDKAHLYRPPPRSAQIINSGLVRERIGRRGMTRKGKAGWRVRRLLPPMLGWDINPCRKCR